MPNNSSEGGIVHLFPLISVFVIAFVLVSSQIPVSRTHQNGTSSVQGVMSSSDSARMEKAKQANTEVARPDVKIASSNGQLAIVNKDTGALSRFPLTIDPLTRQLTVTTPAGSRIVTVLPEKAIANMLASHVMDDVISEKVNNELASVPRLVALETKNGVLGYRVRGVKKHKFLGFIPIKTSVEAFVSAENGQVVDTQTSLFGRILNRIAP